MDNEITRFDVPAPVRQVILAATGCNVVDAVDVAALVLAHGSDWSAIVRELVEVAWTLRHDPRGRSAHAAVCEAADRFWAGEVREDEGEDVWTDADRELESALDAMEPCIDCGGRNVEEGVCLDCEAQDDPCAFPGCYGTGQVWNPAGGGHVACPACS